jgi:thiamine transport system ATP-binding protein
MLHLDRITLAQGDFRLTADWQANPGDRIAVLGPSGGGKSTLLSAIAGFLTPTEGRILWQGQDITATPPGQRPVSILFQDQNLFPHLTVARNLALGINPGLRMAPGDAARIDDVLARTGLSGMGDRRPASLSGGQQGRVALARALLRARPVLLLDPALKAEMLVLLSEVAAQTDALTFLVTHDPDDARAFAPLTVVVADGLALPPAPTGPLLDNPPPALAAYLGT